MLLADDLVQGPRPHPHGQRQVLVLAGSAGISQAATGAGRLGADPPAEQVLAHSGGVWHSGQRMTIEGRADSGRRARSWFCVTSAAQSRR